MENNLLNSNSVELPVKVATDTAMLPGVNSVEEIVLYDECGDTLWDKVLAQDARLHTLKQQLPE
jgi:hypothetical protein